MVTKKGNKTVRELSFELNELAKIVESLQEEIERLKEQNKNNVTLSQNGKMKNNSFPCTKCEEKFTDVRALKNHRNRTHQNKIKCKQCNYEGLKLSDIEEHILTNHGTQREFECNQCQNSFVSELRLKKHMKTHQNTFKINFCHYYNNNKECPYQRLGCMFKHSDAKHCRNGDKCNRKLCQFKHSVIIQKTLNKDNVPHENETSEIRGDKESNPGSQNLADVIHSDQHEEEVTLKSNTNEKSEETDIKTFEEFYCEHFCAGEYGIHVHDEKEVSKYKGVNMDEIEIDMANKKSKVYTCVECDNKSKGLIDHKNHFKDVHGDLEYSIDCLFETCDFGSENPKELIAHFAESHKKSVTKLLQKFRSTQQRNNI